MRLLGKNAAHSGADEIRIPSLLNAALAHCQAGCFADATPLFHAVLAINPKQQDALFHFSSVLAYSGQFEDALQLLTRLVSVNSKIPQAFNNLGSIYYAPHRYEEAVNSFYKATKLEPRYAEAHYKRGLALEALHRLPDALASFERAIAISPDFIDAHNCRGLVLREMGRHDAAMACFEHIVQRDPKFAHAHNNKGVSFFEQNRLQDALLSFDAAIALDANYAEPHFNKATCLLLAGRLREGFELYEWRWRLSVFEKRPEFFEQTQWFGQAPLAGKTILLYSEQGLGDVIQFCRFAVQLKAMGAHVVLEVPRALCKVLSGLAGVDQLLAAGDVLPPFDFCAPLMSLPRALDVSLETLSSAAYLTADPLKAAAWAERLGERRRLRIGLVWSGGFRADRPDLWAVNTRRNVAVELLASLQCVEADFYSLQKGDPAETEILAKQEKLWPRGNFHNFAAELQDFSDTAALIANLDLVISVDTSTAHLSAAMGKPTWILNRFDCCWRWLQERNDSPWYESVRLYRQSAAGDWQSVLQSVSTDLALLADSMVKA
jgi:tetratricopeptide (TPR) repeat protein